MDEYSLHQVMVNEHCTKVSERMKHPIICKSVVDVSLESGSPERLLSLSESLDAIQHNNIGKQIDVVIDELDGEDLNEEEIKNLKSKLESAEYKSSLILISLQSCQKKRKLEHYGVVKNETKLDLNVLGIEIFQLEKSMRFTSNINNAVTKSLNEIEVKANIYHFDIPKQETTDTQKETQEEITETQEEMAEDQIGSTISVSYTHLTLPTIYSV